jgi:hypothetical protein
MPILEQIRNQCIQEFNHLEYHSSGIINENTLPQPYNPFYDAFYNYIKNLEEIKYILLMENPLSYGTYICNQKGNGSWINAINRAFEIDVNNERLNQWQKKGILPLDIYQFFCLNDGVINGKSLDTKAREKLGAENILNYPYPVFRTYLAFEYLNNLGIQINKGCKLAVMMPNKTSIHIFNYFNNPINQDTTLITGEIDFAPFLRTPNILFHQRYKDTIFPLHKVNTIGANNITPDAYLIRIACDLGQ